MSLAGGALSLGRWATEQPDRPAIVMAGSGATTSYGALDESADRIAHVLRGAGAGRGTHLAYVLPNGPGPFEVSAACLRSGLYFTPLSTRLTASEVAYILRDASTHVVVVGAAYRDLGIALRSEPDAADVRTWLSVGGEIPGYERLEDLKAVAPPGPIVDPSPGTGMMYSSGTTGRPKGIKRPLPTTGANADDPFLTKLADTYGFDRETVYLCPAPLYHGAGHWYSTAMHRLGATTVVMEKFTPEAFLAAVQTYRVTHTQVVPTMLIRLLRLDDDVRGSFDLSSLTILIHAAAPCPVPVKEAIIDWLGPIVWEYFAATEANGMTIIGPDEWLAHRGSVGRAVIGRPHIVDESGAEAPPNGIGTVFFEGVPAFEYHADSAKTAESRHPAGWTTTGDIGYLDDEGYLYLTDRKSFTIISGGINIYPQEIENVLAVHPEVADVAVFGVPDPEFGESVLAVVQLRDPSGASAEAASALIEWCRERLAHYKCPKAVDFRDELPREENGKLYKRVLRDAYWAELGKRPDRLK